MKNKFMGFGVKIFSSIYMKVIIFNSHVYFFLNNLLSIDLCLSSKYVKSNVRVCVHNVFKYLKPTPCDVWNEIFDGMYEIKIEQAVYVM